MSVYEIYALKYAGPFTGPGALMMWMKDWDVIVERCYFIWCIRGNGHTVVVDAGVSPERAREKDLAGYVSPAEMLARIGVKADEVRHVILTHIHWDHVNGIGLFPNATFYLQEEEFRFWMKDPIAQRPPFGSVSDHEANGFIASLEGTDRLVLLKGDTEILPGIECLLTPGHTIGLQSVAVDTSKGKAIIGSDCGHLFQNYREDWPSTLITNLIDWMKSFEKLRDIASSPDLLFPGHDPLMITNYPSVAKDVSRLA